MIWVVDSHVFVTELSQTIAFVGFFSFFFLLIWLQEFVDKLAVSTNSPRSVVMNVRPKLIQVCQAHCNFLLTETDISLLVAKKQRMESSRLCTIWNSSVINMQRHWYVSVLTC